MTAIVALLCDSCFAVLLPEERDPTRHGKVAKYIRVTAKGRGWRVQQKELEDLVTKGSLDFCAVCTKREMDRRWTVRI